MPSSMVRTFSDPDDYAAAIHGARIDLTITGRGQFAAKLIRIDLHRLWMQRFSDNLPGISHWTIIRGRAVISFRTRPGPSLLWGGVETLPNVVLRHSEGECTFQRSSGSLSRAAMSLPVEDMVSAGSAAAGLDLTPPRAPLIVIPPPVAMARLQRLHATAGYLAEEAPEIIANPHAAHGLEQELIAAMVDCLGKGAADEDRVAQRQHQLIMRRFRRVLEEKLHESLYITEICRAIGISIRTLQICCQEELGMGPKRYLLVRRLHMARRALRAAAPDATTVTDIATRYGFWHLGRFAGEYRSLFGESPSVMLHRQPE